MMIAQLPRVAAYSITTSSVEDNSHARVLVNRSGVV